MNKLWALITQALHDVITAVQGITTKVPQLSAHLPQTQRKEFSAEVVRPDDLLVLTLDFYNLRIKSPGGDARLERVGPGNGFIVARFQPQSIAEQAFFEQADGAPIPGPGDPPVPPAPDPLLPPPVASRIAGPSQLVFRISDAQLPLAFDLGELLRAMRESEPVVQPRILRPSAVPPVGGQANFGGTRSQYSAIEAPVRLILSPDAQSRWLHADAPAKSADLKRTELWHTRLEGKKPTVSAVWSPDYDASNADPPPDDTNPFRTSLHAENRHQIVRSTSDHTLEGAKPAPVGRLLLSSQGAWMSLHAKWQTPLPLVEWRHIMTAGRDQYVRVVKEGNLFWGCHRAVFIKITERKVQMCKAGPLEGKAVAYLRQRYLVIVREPTRTYTHRHFPYRSVTIKTLVTPNLDLPETDDFFNHKENAFWPRVAGKNFEFQVEATDWEGRVSEFPAPMAFIVKTIADDPAKMDPIIAEYNKHVEAKRPQWERGLRGQKIAYAPPKDAGDTSLETLSMVFNAMKGSGSPRFLPMMHTAQVDVPAVREISGNTAPSTIKLDEKFAAASGDFGNMTEVFAQLVGTQTDVSFSSDKTGGMVAPDFQIAGLSRAFGPVGAEKIEEFADGSFNPGQMFAGVKVLGGIPLASIIKGLDNATPAVAGTRIPRLQSVRAVVDGKQVVETFYRWDLPKDFLAKTDLFEPEDGAQFFIAATVTRPLDGSPPDMKVEGALRNFKVKLRPGDELVALRFTEATFTARPNAKVDFGVVFNKFEFLGDLAFVNRLADVIPMDGFDDPPFLKLVLPPDPRPGVLVGFTQGIPTVGIGIFTLQNISFGASFYLPFINDPANLRLAFCERHQPFILTVSLFGGGGFFAIDIGFEGVRQIEAALEFGAAIALNLGVASGSASVMGGVYYRTTGADFEFSAYFRAAGALSVLGIITVSVELYIALTFTSKGLGGPHAGKLWGEARITVKIKIAFFSVKVSIGIEREFAGSDPKFIDAVSPSDWIDYCESFADYPA